jgi:hypothetical protein
MYYFGGEGVTSSGTITGTVFKIGRFRSGVARSQSFVCWRHLGRMHMTMRLLSIVPLLVVLALVCAPVKSSHAASGSCAMLLRQLASTPNSNSVPQRNGPLIQRQARQVQQMRAKANAQGCGGFLFSRGEPAVCKRYTQALQAMSAKLAKLQKASDRPSAAQPSRQQLLASLEAKGCNDRVASAGRRDNAPNIERRTLLEVLFGGTRSNEPAASAPKAMLKRQLDAREAHRRRSAGPETLAATYEGTEPSVNGIVKKGYRTLCVRTCDGYSLFRFPPSQNISHAIRMPVVQCARLGMQNCIFTLCRSTNPTQ